MTKSKFAQTVLASAAATLVFSGVAFADTANISLTGPESTNTVSAESSNHVDLTNADHVTVTNSNTQSAKTGDATVSYNTTAGAAQSGAATNANTVSTTIGIKGLSTICSCVALGGGGSNPGSSTTTPHASSAPGVGSSQGSVGTLPETGAHLPVDVSALRNLFNPVSQTTPLTAAVKSGKTISTVVLALAAVLSLAGAIGTAVYSTKRTLRV